jgi:23S rRNA A2030 N6-methylase RlmJ
LTLWERDDATFARLGANTRGDQRVRLVRGDGLEAIDGEIRDAEGRSDAQVVLVDPAYTQKADWILVPDAIARALRGSDRASVVLWYPIKSLTRPNAMVARLAAAGVPGTIAELVTTPLAHQRRRLNGSGVLLVRAPDGVHEALAAAAPVLGERCATHAGAWSFRMQSWA